jgi:hypothetical protein
MDEFDKEFEAAPSKDDLDHEFEGAPAPKSRIPDMLRALTQGVFLGHGDEIVSAMETAPKMVQEPRAALELGLGGGLVGMGAEAEKNPIVQEYRARQAENRPVWEKAAEDHPVAEFVGALRSPVKVKSAAATGALGGALYGLGEADRLDPAAMAPGAVLGGLAGGVLGGAAKVLGKVADKTKKVATEQALKAIGARSTDISKLRTKGKLDEVVEALHRFGIIKAGSTIDDIAARAESAKDAAGSKVGEVLRKVDEVAGGPKFEVPQAISALEQGPIGSSKLPGLEGPVVSPALKSRVDLLQGEAEALKQLAPKQTFADMNRVKSDYGSRAKFHQRDAAERSEAFQDLYGILNEQIEQQVPKATNPRLLEEFLAAKKDYGPLAEVDDLAFKALSSRMANSPVGLSASPIEFIKQRAPSTSAATARALSKILGGAAKGTSAVAASAPTAATGALSEEDRAILMKLLEGK